jgi:hypothetical protein
LFYRTNTNAPSISQLQDIVDNSNPLQLRIGNPNLVQEYTHSMNARFVDAQWMQGKTMFGFVNVSYTQNYIGNSVTFLRPGDTIGRAQFSGDRSGNTTGASCQPRGQLESPKLLDLRIPCDGMESKP